MDWSCWNWGWGTMMFGGFGMLALWGLAIGLVIWAVRGASGSGFGGGNPPAGNGSRSTALDILQARYARGEIGRDEYETILRDLKDG